MYGTAILRSNLPTRFRGDDEPSTIDLIFTNEENMVSDLEYTSPVGKSDHCVLLFRFNCHTIIKHEKKTKRLYKQANYGQIIHDINSINWMSMTLMTCCQCLIIKLKKLRTNMCQVDQHLYNY